MSHREMSHRKRRMLAAIAGVLPVAAVLIFVPIGANATVPAPPAGWTTVFSDDFNGTANTAPSSANWIYDLGTSYPGGAGNWGTGEVETNTNSTSNVYLDGSGHLVIKPIKDSERQLDVRPHRDRANRLRRARPAARWRSPPRSSSPTRVPASATGRRSGQWVRPRVRSARPTGRASVSWTSWRTSTRCPRCRTRSTAASTRAARATRPPASAAVCSAAVAARPAYHTYSVIVDRTNTSAEQLRFYTDGALQLTVNESQVGTATWTAAVDHGFFAILNVAIGGAYPNAICGCGSPSAATSSGAAMSVDYVAGDDDRRRQYDAPDDHRRTTDDRRLPRRRRRPLRPARRRRPEVGTGTIQAEAYNAQSGTRPRPPRTPAAARTWATSPMATGCSTTTSTSAPAGARPVQGPSGLRRGRRRQRPGRGASRQPEQPVDRQLRGRQHRRLADLDDGPGEHHPTTGTHTVFLEFTSGQPADFVNINWFTFALTHESTAGPRSGAAPPLTRS